MISNRNIALIGFMGTGKSSAGHAVAQRLGFSIVDTDLEIEQRSSLAIPQIFEQSGEAAFRQMERDLVRELSLRTRTVIITGGGLGADQANLDSLKTHALVVCLWASPDVIFKRVQNQASRPLLRTENPLQTISDLLALRKPFYKQAQVLIDTTYRGPAEVVDKIVRQFLDTQR